MQYPILTTNTTLFIPNPAFTIVPVVDTTILIDGFPVVTKFAWTNNSSGATGTIVGQSLSTLANSMPVVLVDAIVSAYYTISGIPSVLSD